MRLRRLDLIRYGRFTDYSVDFGERAPGAPDLHIIYGPNEAGKSTLFSAWLDLLYGIGMQSPFNFLHPYPTMRIGGILELSGGAREMARIKRPQNSLLDAHEQPVAENSILGELGGVDREAYRTMFSLDDDTLEEGGENILKARGDLGQLLFSGSSGLADLSHKITNLHAEADAFYRSHARSGQLHDLQKELVRRKQEKDQIDTQASKYAELAEDRRRSKARYDELTANRGQIQARKDEIQRLLSARPRLAKLRSLREQLAPLEELPSPPVGWTEELSVLRDDEIKLETKIQANAEEIKQSASASDEIVVDETALRMAGKPDEITSLRARYMTADKDLPDRREKLRELDFAVLSHLHQLEREGEAEPERLVLSASTVERLRELIESHSGVETTKNKAVEELAEAGLRLKEAAEKLDSANGAAAADTEREAHFWNLKEALSALRASDHVARRRLAERACVAARAMVSDSLAGMTPWKGELDELVAMTLPDPETIQKWKMAQENIREKCGQQSREIERLKSEGARLSTQQDALSSVTGVVTDQEAAEIRAERDHAWAEHRGCLDADSADRFEELLRRDDSVGAQRFGHIAELTQLHEAAKSFKIAQSDLVRAEELYAQTVAEAEKLARDLAKAMTALSPMLPPDWSLAQLEAWIAGRKKALEARVALRTAEWDLEQAQKDSRVARERLAASLEPLHAPLPADAEEAALVAAAQSVVDQDAQMKRLREAHDERRRELRSRERALERAGTKKGQWDSAWKEICGSCWLGEHGAAPTIASVRGALTVTAKLAADLKERTMLAERIGKMEADQTAYRNELRSLADQLQIAGAESLAVMELDRVVHDRIRKAEFDNAQKSKELDRLNAARGMSRKLAEKRLAHDRRKHEMTSFFGVSTLTELASKFDQVSARNSLRREAAEVLQDILDGLRLIDIREAEAALDRADQAAQEMELAEISAKSESVEQEWRDSYAEYKAAEHQIEAIGGDAKVAAIEEQRSTILVEIQEGARRYMRLRAGAVAMEQALRFYRERHRSSMMARASEALSIISRGAYTHLTTQPEKDSEVLVAIAANKSSKLVTEMSKGTRFQLYLALRVAGYFEFAKARSPVPFIADDIMETFDDFRAEEAFRLFAQMAGTGQVIYLTHHRHLCEIAREVCSTVHVHDLSDVIAPERQSA